MIIDSDTLKVNALFKFKLLGIMKELEPNIANFEIIKNEKVKEYGKESEDGRFMIQQDDQEAFENFSSDMSSILDEAVEINISILKPDEVFDKGVPAEYLLGIYKIID